MTKYQDHSITSSDGLRLYVRDYPCPDPRLTILCLHGLTRNCSDFEELAALLNKRHRVVVMEQRGRGRSDYDANPEHYNVMTYVADTFALLDELEIRSVVLIGTSMGGLMALLMASMQPDRIAGVVLNDVGPVVENAGIARVQGYLGKTGPLESWQQGAALVRNYAEIAFPDWDEAQWLAFAHRVFVEDDAGVIRMAYDPAIGQTLLQNQSTAVPPDLWSIFDTLAKIPILVLRGALSDILAMSTVKEMQARHPTLQYAEVPNRGHAPMLNEQVATQAITRFLTALE